MNISTKFNNNSISEKAKNRGLKHITLHCMKCVTSLVSMDIMESIEVIKLYNRNIKRSYFLLLNVLDQSDKNTRI